MKSYPTRYADYAKSHGLSCGEAMARDTALNPRAALAPFYDWLIEQTDMERVDRIREQFAKFKGVTP